MCISRTRLLFAVTLLLSSSLVPVGAAQDFFVVSDDGTIAETVVRSRPALQAVLDVIDRQTSLDDIDAELISFWSTFPMGGANQGTRYIPQRNSITGIGFESVYGGDGTFEDAQGRVIGLMFHNNFLAMEELSGVHGTSPEGYGEYLFLLELSHTWGPAIQAPGEAPGRLIGFTYHWSFYLDVGEVSPAGGNVWVDGGAGSFTIQPNTPLDVRFSMLDLYLMGLAEASEVPPIGLIRPDEHPAVVDPIWRAPAAERTFPWFDADQPVTVTGTREELTIEELIQVNGPRLPAFGDAPTTLDIAFVLITEEGASSEEVARNIEDFASFREGLMASYGRATRGRGELNLVRPRASIVDAGVPAPDAALPVDAGQPGDASTTPDAAGSPPAQTGCSVYGHQDSVAFGWLLALALVGMRLGPARRRR